MFLRQFHLHHKSLMFFENGEREFTLSQSNVRESGENPERLRHCNRLQTPRSQ